VPELGRHDDPRDNAEPERHTENFQPEFKNQTIGGTPGCEVECLQNREPSPMVNAGKMM
jgi:hypothetical protein